MVEPPTPLKNMMDFHFFLSVGMMFPFPCMKWKITNAPVTTNQWPNNSMSFCKKKLGWSHSPAMHYEKGGIWSSSLSSGKRLHNYGKSPWKQLGKSTFLYLYPSSLCTQYCWVSNFFATQHDYSLPWSKKTSSTWAMTSGPLIQLRKTSYCVVYTHFIPTLSPHFPILS